MSVSKPSISAKDLGTYKSAIQNAMALHSIGFPEFTAKLINDTFDALISANIRQSEVYVSLFNKISGGLTTYINDTKDEIDVGAVMDFLKETLSAELVNKIITASTETTSDTPASLNSDEAEALNEALTPKNERLAEDKPVNIGIGIIKSQLDAIINACAIRISENKYNLLKTMMEMGVLRLVVDSGTIETKIVFHTFDHYDMKQNVTETMSIETSRSVNSIIFGLIRSTKSTYMTISPVTASASGNSDTDITITGTVKINFKSDYKPLLTQT